LSGEDGRAVRSSSGPEGEAMRLAVLESISGPGIINVTNCRKPQFWSFAEKGRKMYSGKRETVYVLVDPT
jgi:hypothetical protein